MRKTLGGFQVREVDTWITAEHYSHQSDSWVSFLGSHLTV